MFVCFIASASFAQQEAYWQQKVDHTIEVRLDDDLHYLHAFETVNYHNQSPDTLDFLIFHLWPNAYRNRKTALAKQLVRMGQTTMLFSTSAELGYIDSLAFELDGKPCLWTFDPKHIDICTLLLEQPLLPGRQVVVSTPFRVKLPSGDISRLGHIDESYQITQWFPKPAVYDTKGWHGMPYLTQGEFFSEYGSYDVKITVPKNYTVGATGDLQTADEMDRLEGLVKETEQWIARIEKEGDWTAVQNENAFPESDSAFKTLHYTQDRVHDFAWFADKRFHVLNGKVGLPGKADSVTVWTMFTNVEASLWKESIEYMHDAIYYYSLWNGNYPYDQATAVDGTISAGGGMEYPNVTVIGGSGDALALETVIMHEVGHNWFYGILGSNERRYAWMDEGLNSYNEHRYLSTKYPDSKLFVGNNSSSKFIPFLGLNRYSASDIHYLTYLLAARENSDQPSNLPSDKFSLLNYGAVVYSKPAVWFNYLRHYVGDSTMDLAMHAYFDTYKFKHPYPEDFESILSEEIGKDLSWLFDKGIDSTAKIDYAIGKIGLGYGQTTVTIKNRGGVASPVLLAFYENGKEVGRTWIEGFHGKKLYTFNGVSDQVVIDPDCVVPELRRTNNRASVKGTFKRVEPVQLKWLGQLEDPSRTEVYYTPLLGLSVPGGLTPGIAFYNSILPIRKWNWALVPMFSTKSSSFSGLGELYYAITPEGSLFQSIDLGVKGRRFTHDNDYRTPTVEHLNFTRIEPYVRFNLRPYKASGMWDDEFSISSVLLSEDLMKYDVETASTLKSNRRSVFTRLRYDLQYDHPAYGTQFVVRGEVYEEFLRASVEVINQLVFDDYLRVRNRLFVGGFMSNNATDPIFNYRMEGQSARNDYAYDGIFLDRSSAGDVLSKQLTETHGGFKIPTAVGSSNVGLASYNLEMFFSKFPIGVFADAGYAFQGEALFDAGICLSGKRRIFGLYLPLIYSDNIEQEVTANGLGMFDLIRFQLSLDLVNPFALRKHIQF